jgi:hypothetical protein
VFWQANNFKHLAISTFYEFFALDEAGNNHHQFLQWEKKEDNFEQIVVHINYSMLYQNCPNAVKQFLDYICEYPNDITCAMALALDSVRLYVIG